MSDPAIEAAERAWDSAENSAESRAARAGAREALAPLRELHKPVDAWEYDDTNGVWVYGPDDERVLLERWCAECTTDEVLEDLGDCAWAGQTFGVVSWPCDTAKLIYPSEDL